jgi:hypothetical protein
MRYLISVLVTLLLCSGQALSINPPIARADAAPENVAPNGSFEFGVGGPTDSPDG